MTTDLRPLHRRSLDVAGAVVGRVEALDLVRPSPCLGWDLGALLGHAIGQNHGFAVAVEAPGAPLGAFAPRPVAPDELAEAWQVSADRVADAFAAVSLDDHVLLAEFSAQVRFPVSAVVGFHLLDTVVHTWDIATALGEQFRPDAELVAATLAQAQRIPDGPDRERPGAPFAPSVPIESVDDWDRTLAILGRR
ncbi:MAG: TIGR03086 family metal-binding protein [Actinomycetota bacterium]|nr:TIGR03086 family metal-binding protein [Actinomycetota bacterium]